MEGSKNMANSLKFTYKDKIGLFSGRFDPPHTGHIIAIEDLMTRFMKVYVVILAYKGREACTAFEARTIFNHHFDRILPIVSRNKVEILINTDHFGFISKEKITKLPHFDVYLAGNEQVLRHMESLGYECEDVSRTKIFAVESLLAPIEAKINMQKIYSGTMVRKLLKKMGKTFRDHYRLS